MRRLHQRAQHAVNPRLHVELLQQRRREIQQRDRDRVVGGDACPRELDRWRAIEVREFRQFVSRHRSVRQFDLRDEAPRQAKLLGHGGLAQATVFARLAQIRGEGLSTRDPREDVAGVGRQTTPLRDDARARLTVGEVVGMTRCGLFVVVAYSGLGLVLTNC